MKAVAVARKLIRLIPGFRQMSKPSMVLAATWYGAAILTMANYWHWGLALLALPFLVFYLLDAGRAANRLLYRVVPIAAGLLVLLGTVAGLASGSQRSPSFAYAGPAGVDSQPSAWPSATVSPKPFATGKPTASPSAVPTATHGQTGAAEAAQYACVAAKGSDVFHEPGCASAKKIKPENLIGFSTREEAIAAGLRPCKKCKP